jgi:hypothetical protein
MTPQPYPERLGAWPAVGGFAFFIWLELVGRVLDGPRLGFILLGYTAITLMGMAQYGRDPWRRYGETFGVWFGVLGRLAFLAPADSDPDRAIRRRPFGSGLVAGPWPVALVVLVALGTGSIIWDGIPQTRTFYDVFSFPDATLGTVLMAAFLGALVALVLLVARSVGLAAMGAGLLPVAVGYLIAHYLTTLLFDGQRILVAISDPFQQGWDLFGTAFFEPDLSWLPVSAIWTIQVGAVVIGHVVGAWAGHAALRRGDARPPSWASQLPLALLMIGLTSLTLWSLGQNLLFDTGVA